MSFEFTEKATQIISDAEKEARNSNHIQVTPLHFAVALLADLHGPSRLKGVIEKANGDVQKFERSLRQQLVRLPSQDPLPSELSLSPLASKVLQEAQRLKLRQKDSYISQDHILLALADDPSFSTPLKESGLDKQVFKEALESSVGNRHVDSRNAEEGFDALNRYTTNLTELARKGSLDPVIGREDEIRRTIRILSRRTKNNPVLIGDPGVGKTAIAEGLAQVSYKSYTIVCLICF